MSNTGLPVLTNEPEQQVADDTWLKLIGAMQSVCTLEPLWPFDLHFPICCGPGTNNRDPPFTFAIAENMLDHGYDFRSCPLIARVLHVNYYGHNLNFIEVGGCPKRLQSLQVRPGKLTRDSENH